MASLSVVIIVLILLAIGLGVMRLSLREGFSIDPQDTGMERALWGPLYPVERSRSEFLRHSTMHSLPWCSPPLDKYPGCARRRRPIKYLPYEQNKI